MESRISLDQEIDIPYSLIDPAEWNPKTPVHGVYRTGLRDSLNWFGIRSRLKVTPHFETKGRYISIDGNQRLDVIGEHLLNMKIRDYFKLEDSISDTTFRKLVDDPQNTVVIAKLRKSLPKCMIPCQVITKLDEHTKFSKSDAKLFAATFNRNAARYDEIKQADIYREIVNERIVGQAADRQRIIESHIKSMVRPELPIVQPVNPAINTTESQKSFQFDQPGKFTPTESQPWGREPPAPDTISTQASSSAAQFIPLVFSLTREGYAEITDSILRSKSRIFRENRLKEALEKLEKFNPGDLDSKIDAIIAETALLTIDKHIEKESNGDPSS